MKNELQLTIEQAVDEVASWPRSKRDEGRRAGLLDRALTEEWFDEWRRQRDN